MAVEPSRRDPPVRIEPARARASFGLRRNATILIAVTAILVAAFAVWREIAWVQGGLRSPGPVEFVRSEGLGGLVFIALLGGGALLALALTRRFVEPTEILVNAVRALSRGELDAPVPRFQNRDFANIGQALDHLARNLREARAREGAHRAELEHVVGRRTEELTSTVTQLRAMADAAEAAARERYEFVVRFGSEVRSPLTAALGMTELMLQSSLGDEPRRLAVTAHSACQEMAALVNSTLDFSAAELGRIELVNTPFRVDDLVEEVLEGGVTPMAGLDAVALPHIEVDVPRVLEGDPTRLRQVLSILLSHALSGRADRPVLVRVAVESRIAGRVGLRFELDDRTGGVEPELIEDLFEPFAYQDDARGAGVAGSGLGLAFCRRLVELLGGSIGYEPTEHGGTWWFTVVLGETGSDERGTSLPLAGVQVLVVSERALAAGSVSSQLARLGAVARVIGSGQQALSRLEVRDGPAVSVVVLDLSDSRGEGRRFLAALRAGAPRPEVTVIGLVSRSASAG